MLKLTALREHGDHRDGFAVIFLRFFSVCSVLSSEASGKKNKPHEFRYAFVG